MLKPKCQGHGGSGGECRIGLPLVTLFLFGCHHLSTHIEHDERGDAAGGRKVHMCSRDTPVPAEPGVTEVIEYVRAEKGVEIHIICLCTYYNPSCCWPLGVATTSTGLSFSSTSF